MFPSEELPALDCHAHLAPDVTLEQLQRLGGTQILAVTRSLREAAHVAGRNDPDITWACGVHPADEPALAEFSSTEFRGLLARFAAVGEVGLDARGGSAQERVFAEILALTADEPVLLSIHSTGRTERVLEMISARPQRGAILHWFLGTIAEVELATKLDCYFSVGAAMNDEQLSRMPRDRLLPETDFPAGRRRGGGSLPGQTQTLEQRLSALWQTTSEDVRRQFYRNLRCISTTSGAIERMPDGLADLILIA